MPPDDSEKTPYVCPLCGCYQPRLIELCRITLCPKGKDSSHIPDGVYGNDEPMSTAPPVDHFAFRDALIGFALGVAISAAAFALLVILGHVQ